MGWYVHDTDSGGWKCFPWFLHGNCSRKEKIQYHQPDTKEWWFEPQNLTGNSLKEKKKLQHDIAHRLILKKKVWLLWLRKERLSCHLMKLLWLLMFFFPFFFRAFAFLVFHELSVKERAEGKHRLLQRVGYLMKATYGEKNTESRKKKRYEGFEMYTSRGASILLLQRKKPLFFPTLSISSMSSKTLFGSISLSPSLSSYPFLFSHFNVSFPASR